MVCGRIVLLIDGSTAIVGNDERAVSHVLRLAGDSAPTWLISQTLRICGDESALNDAIAFVTSHQQMLRGCWRR